MYKKKLSRLLLSGITVVVSLFPLAPVNSVTFQPKGSPQRTSGGASRGICIQERASSQSATGGARSQVVALIPATDGELTAAAYPTILVQIPESQPLKAEFSLWDENSNGIYQTTLTLTGIPGIVSFTLPDTAPALETGKRYKWTVAVICDPKEPLRNVVVEGWLERKELSSALKSEINSAEPLQKVEIYAKNGYWYETVATLAELKRSRPQDRTISAEWQQLLQSVGLSEFGQAPIVNCCQPQNN